MSLTTLFGDASHLTRALFAQDQIWVTARSEVKVIAEMDDTHVLNTLLMIERITDFPSGLDVHGSALYKALYGRLVEKLDPEVEGMQPDFVMPERPIATRRTEIHALLRDLQHDVDRGQRRFKMDYIKEDGTESRRVIAPLEVYERSVGLGFEEFYIKAIDVDIAESRTFRADRIQRLEEVPVF